MAATPDLTSKLLAEFVGTFLLIFTIGCNVLSGNAVWGGISIASVLMVAIYALGSISGAMFNPAVAVAVHACKAMGEEGIEIQTGSAYIATQIVAGIVAACTYSFMFGHTFNLEPAPGYNALQAGLCEVLYTFMLCFVVLNVAVAKENTPNHFYGLAIGHVIVAGAYGAGAVSGGCFNPAVAIGLDVASIHLGFGYCLVYTACHVLGAVLAAALFRVCRPVDFGGEGGGLVAKCTSEFLGTFILVLTVGLNVLNKSPAGAYSIAASLMCMIYALGNVSGAHFNPAVTLALAIVGADSTPYAAPYIVSQLAGGGLAAFTYAFICQGETFALGPGAGYGMFEVGVSEVVYTFVLCYVVLAVAFSITTKQSEMYGLAIGACVTVGGNAIGAISGGSLNPAVSFGIGISHMALAGGSLVNFLIYSAFELVGAGLAAGVYMATHRVDAEHKALKAEESKA